MELRPRQGLVIASLLTGISGCVLGLSSLAIGTWTWMFAYTTYGPAAIPRWASPWLWAAPFLGVIGAAGLIIAWWISRRWVEATAEGLVVHTGRRVNALRWGAIRQIRVSAVRPSPWPGGSGRYSSLVLAADGSPRIRFGRTLERLDALVDVVRTQVYPLLLEEYRLRFNRGEALAFGPLTLTVDGLHDRRNQIQWRQVAGVEVTAGRLQVTSMEAEAAPIRVRADRVPNVDVCVQIIRYLGQVT